MPQSPRIAITLSKDVLKILDKKCNETGLTRSSYLTSLLVQLSESERLLKEMLPSIERKMIESIEQAKK